MKTKALKMLAILLAAVLLAGSSAFAAEGLTDVGDNFRINPAPEYEKLTSRIPKTSHSNSFTGSILIATDEEIILFGGPKAETTAGLPVDPHTTWDIGSCSKMFTAVAIFQLIEQGKISLDDPITRFFPDYEAGKDITVYHLLHMQSGIPDYVNEPDVFWGLSEKDDMEALIRRIWSDQVPDEELLQNMYAAPLHFTPGTECSYCNTNYVLLAMIIEQVTGLKYCDYLQANVFDVCGMEHTTSMAVGDLTSVPKSYTELFNAGIVDENGYPIGPNIERGAGGIHTCPMDLLAFDRALMAGKLVSDASLAEMRNYEYDYGCGLMPYMTAAHGSSFGHSGANGTYVTQNIFAESEKYGRVYILIFTPSDAGKYAISPIMNAALTVLLIY